MSNLLQKASIVTTPTAYGVGVLNSIKPAIAFGEELISCGNFECALPLANWTNNSDGSISVVNGKLKVLNVSGRGRAFRTITGLNAGSTYSFYVENTSGGSVTGFCHIDGNNNIPLNANYIFIASASSITLQVGVGNTTAGDFTFFDNLTLRRKQDADFDFTRNSSATRVNPDYLIQDVSILSSNLVQNGNFSELGSELIINGNFETDSDWVKVQSTISNGKATIISPDGSYAAIYQNILTVGKTYTYNINVSSVTNGVSIFSGSSLNTLITSSGNYQGTFVATNVRLEVKRNNDDIMSATIDNVSVKQVDPNDEWILLNGSTINEGVAKVIANGNIGSAAGNWSLSQNSVFAANKKYKAKFKARKLVGNGNLQVGRDYFAFFEETLTSNFVEYERTFTTGSNLFTGKLVFAGRVIGDELEVKDISVIEVQQTDIPRLDYTNGTASILLEPQSTNLITYSSDFSQWTPDTNASVTSNSIISPDGTQNADKLVAGSSVARQSIKFNLTASGNISAYVFAKKGEYSVIQLTDAVLGAAFANFDLESGLVGSANTYAANIENYGNGWFKCSITYNSVSSINSFRLSIAQSSTSARLVNFAGNSSDGLYIYGAQLENSLFPTSYIPTSGSAVTRAAETLNNAGNSDLINSTEGVLYAEFRALQDGYLSLTDGSSANRIFLGFASLSVYTQVRVGGNVSADMITSAYPSNTILKAAVKYKANDFALWVNGVEVNTDTSGATFPSGVLNNFSFNVGGGSSPFYGNTKAVAVFKEALSDTELACLTSTNNREIFLNYYYRMQYVGANTEALSCAEQTFNI